MRVLWVCNIPIEIISKSIGKEHSNLGGWISGFANKIINDSDIELYYCFPNYDGKLLKGKVNSIHYYGFPSFRISNNILERIFYNRNINNIKAILDEVNPDLMHIFGSEFKHSLYFAQIFNKPKRTIVNIQGLTSIYALHFFGSLPYNLLFKFNISTLIRGTIKSQIKQLENRGKDEISLLKISSNIIGRTDWDRACTFQINPKNNYYFCNESLRESFYSEEKWDINNCLRYSIFVSQSSSPIKGLYNVLKAINLLKIFYPNIMLFIAGNNPTKNDTLLSKLKISVYGEYLKKLINDLELNNNVTFLGSLNEFEMKDRFLKSHVFVSSSTIENESNSISEAKILGVPVIASFVGGVTNRINHKTDGFLYQHDAYYMLSFYLKELFENDDLCNRISKNAIKISEMTHDKNVNYLRLKDIYKGVISNDE